MSIHHYINSDESINVVQGTLPVTKQTSTNSSKISGIVPGDIDAYTEAAVRPFSRNEKRKQEQLISGGNVVE